MRSVFKILAVVAVAIASAGTLPELAGGLVFGRDDRSPVTSAPGSIYAPIGMVFGTPEAGHATAFLVGDCYALTVQHAFGSTRSAIGRKIMFAAGVRGAWPSWKMTPARVIAEGGLQRAPQPTDGYAHDWVLLRLHKCLGRDFGHVRLSERVPNSNEPVAMAGYPADKPMAEGLILEPTCHIRGRRWGVLLHDCSALAGNSGSPLFRVVSDGKRSWLEVFAIHTGGHAFSGPGADLVLPVREYVSNYANVAAALCINGQLGGMSASKLLCRAARTGALAQTGVDEAGS